MNESGQFCSSCTKTGPDCPSTSLFQPRSRTLVLGSPVPRCCDLACHQIRNAGHRKNRRAPSARSFVKRLFSITPCPKPPTNRVFLPATWDRDPRPPANSVMNQERTRSRSSLWLNWALISGVLLSAKNNKYRENTHTAQLPGDLWVLHGCLKLASCFCRQQTSLPEAKAPAGRAGDLCRPSLLAPASVCEAGTRSPVLSLPRQQEEAELDGGHGSTTQLSREPARWPPGP